MAIPFLRSGGLAQLRDRAAQGMVIPPKPPAFKAIENRPHSVPAGGDHRSEPFAAQPFGRVLCDLPQDRRRIIAERKRRPQQRDARLLRNPVGHRPICQRYIRHWFSCVNYDLSLMLEKRYFLVVIGDNISPMNRSDIPSLDDLRAFEATARLGSVRMAADALALTHGAVSRRITKLSEDLGFRLFEKSGRGLRLTAAGETLNLTLGRFFAELATTIDNLRAADPRRNALVLSCEPSVAMRWLIPRLANFQDAHPDIALHLSVGGGPVEFRRERVDLAIRRLDFALPEAWHVQRLFAERMGPVLSPQLAPAFAVGDYIALGSKTRPDAWSHWLSAHPSAHRPAEMRYYDHHFLIVEAASAGLGVALSPLVLATDDVARGRLIAPAGFDPDGSHYGLIWAGDIELGDHARTLAVWLREECRQCFG